MKAKLLTLKRGKRRTLLSCLLFMALLSTGNSLAQTIRYVKPVATGTGDGSSWANASADLQLMLNRSVANDEVWATAGTYVPVRPADATATPDPGNRKNAFVLMPGVKVYGGFSGSETAIDQRSITTNISILSGDLEQDDTYTAGVLTANFEENAAHVVIGAGSIGAAVLDGFTIQGGNADGTVDSVTVNYYSGISSGNGGGLVCLTWDNTQIFRNLIITGNKADSNGGGAYTSNTSCYFVNVAIENNTANAGGGIYVNTGGPIIYKSRIADNTAVTDGGGLYLQSAQGELANTRIINNTAGANGGGFYGNATNAEAVNLLIADNTASDGGGVYYTSGGTSLLNSTIAGNTATTSGGGVYVSSLQLDLKNSIVWGNTAPVSPTGAASNGSINLYYSTLDLDALPDEGQSGLGFTNVEESDNNDPQFIGGTYQLTPGSPAIDSGNNVYFDPGQSPDVSTITDDLNGNIRIVYIVDRGPLETNSAACGFEVTTWNGTEWSNGQPFSFNYSAVIDGDYNSATDGQMLACSLTIASGTTVIAEGTNFYIANEVQVTGGTLEIENNGFLVQANDVVNTGTASIVKNSSALQYLDYTLWSSPVNGSQTLKQFSPGTLDARFYAYNTALSAYSNYTSASGILGNPNTQTFEIGKGYLIRMPDGLPDTGTSTFTGTFTGTPNNGFITVPLSSAGDGYNAVGNPYPSPINVQAFLTANEDSLDDGTLYFWRKTNDPAASSYSTVTSTAFIANTTDASSGADYFENTPAADWIINSGQGFFVKAAVGAPGLSFANDMRRVSFDGPFFRSPVPQNTAADNAVLSGLWLNMTNADSNSGFAQTAIMYTPGATLGLDYGKDGRWLGDSANALFTTVEGTDLVIQTRPAFTATDAVPLAVKTAAAGSYTISLDHVQGLMEPSTLDIFLTDATNGNIQNLKNGSYTFTADAGTFDSRFTVTYADTALGLNNPQGNENGIAVFKKEGSLNITSTGVNLKSVDIFDLQGRRVFSQTDINTTQNVISRPLPQHQVLIVKVTTQDNTVTDRKIIN